MKKNRSTAILTNLFISLLFCVNHNSTSAESHEEFTSRITKNLRSFSDASWNDFIGNAAKDPYEIIRGDSLYGISGRMFGDPSGWPKIWELNNDQIYNPHMIVPGQRVQFFAGLDGVLPSISLLSNNLSSSSVQNNDAPLITRRSQTKDGPGPVYDERTPKRSTAWQTLPRQRWEQVSVQLPANVDAQGFDNRNFNKVKYLFGAERTAFLSCGPISAVGKITGARPNVAGLSTQHEVTVRALGVTLQTGKGYLAVGEPYVFNPKKATQSAQLYPVQGKIRILGVHDGVYLGDVLNHRDVLNRGMLLIEPMTRFIPSQPIAGPKAVTTDVISDPFGGTFMSSAYKTVLLKVGRNAGVEPGMVFRMFQNADPSTERVLTRSNMLVAGDVMVTQVCGDSALGEVLWSYQEIYPNTQAVLLTDVAEYFARYYLNGNYLPSNLGKDLYIPEGIAPETPVEQIPEPQNTEAPPPPAVVPKMTPKATEEPLPELNPEIPALESLAPAEAAAVMQENTPAVVEPTPSPQVQVPEPDLQTPLVPNTSAPEPLPNVEADWLDRVDNGQPLGEQERRELEQLEKYRDQSPTPAPTSGSPDLNVPYQEPQGEDRYIPETSDIERK